MPPLPDSMAWGQERAGHRALGRDKAQPPKVMTTHNVRGQSRAQSLRTGEEEYIPTGYDDRAEHTRAQGLGSVGTM